MKVCSEISILERIRRTWIFLRKGRSFLISFYEKMRESADVVPNGIIILDKYEDKVLADYLWHNEYLRHCITFLGFRNGVSTSNDFAKMDAIYLGIESYETLYDKDPDTLAFKFGKYKDYTTKKGHVFIRYGFIGLLNLKAKKHPLVYLLFWLLYAVVVGLSCAVFSKIMNTM
jgi:hypothetical protein